MHRVAAPTWGAAATRELQGALRVALAPALAQSVAWSCAVIAQNGKLLYDDRSMSAVTPASVQKIIVGQVALDTLGPQYRFHTFLAADSPPREGVVAGALWLIASGDPSLRSDDLRRGALKMRAAGVTAIDGGIEVDGSSLRGPEINPHWDASDANEDFMAPTSGASLDEDTVEFRVTGTIPGEQARVRIKPQSSAVSYFGAITTGYGDDVIIAATGTPNVFRLTGVIPPGVSEIFYLPVHSIPIYDGAVLAVILRESGISVVGGMGTGKAPAAAAILWDHPSPALTQLLRHMMIFSDNHFAEQFLRVLGARANEPDDAGGLRFEQRWLRAHRIPAPGLHLVDGSGLSNDDRIAAITLARVLAHADADSAGNQLYPLLARGGIDGTLKWYHFTQARGRVRAKSGHLAAVSSLAGYVKTRRHGRVVFAFLVNGVRESADRSFAAAVDRLAQR